jgi:hypothetical protein
MPIKVLERHYLVQGEQEEQGVEQQYINDTSKTTSTMGNAVSSTGACTLGMESIKDDILTVVTSEDVQEFMHESEKEQAARSSHRGRALENSQCHHHHSSRSVNKSHGQVVSSRTTNGDGSHLHNHHLPRPHPKKFLKRSWRKSHNIIHKITHAVGDTFHKLELYMFPRLPPSLLGGSINPQTVPTTRVRGGVLLHACHTDEEHKEKVRTSIELLRPLYGEEGLQAIGLEYRVVSVDYENTNTTSEEKSETSSNSEPDLSEENESATTESGTGEEKKDEEHTTMCRKEQPEVVASSESCTPAKETDPSTLQTRLFHIETNTMLTERNRKQYIADGDFYDAVARLSQEVAQETMIKAGHLKWATICDAGNNPAPIRALVSSDFDFFESERAARVKPTLLIATGKGKVRAGIFSRQHLLLSGMECSTALPVVREAVKRDMNIIMLDPNVHGDRMGMVTFEKSMASIFQRWEEQQPEQGDEGSNLESTPLTPKDLFILSHSQSGAQLARYLLEKSEHYVPHIRAVAFTDSTHNIQWARENEDLRRLLESDNCVYFKASKEHSNIENRLKPLDTLGEKVETDHFWEHRFGKVRTRCAGTTEHSLTNWFAHQHIWEHFDSFLPRSFSNLSFSRHER